MYDNTSRVIEVDINEILPNRFQPRIQFDEEEILELSDSIKEHGVIQPLVVRPIGDKYEIIAGERRYKASVLAGKDTVPVIVKALNDKDSAEIALIENIQRKNLTPIEEALSYKKILDMGYITQENLAIKLGKSQSSVANKIRLLNLSDEVQEALLENKISERHARSLLKLSTSKQQNEMLNRIISERLTVRRTDEEIEKIKNNPPDEDNGEQKVIEKGEIDMNNNTFGMPNVPQNTQSTTSFDIFGGQQSAPVENVPTQPEVAAMPQAPNFDIFGGPTSTSVSVPMQPVPDVQPVVPTVQEVPVMPSIAPVVEAQPVAPTMPTMGGIQFDPNANVVSAPMESAPAQPEVPVMPSIAPVVEAQQPVAPTMPTMGGIQFDVNGNVVAAPMESAPAQPEVPVMPSVTPVIDVQPVVEIPSVPQTAPIMESPVVDNTQMTQQSEDLFSFGNINTTPVVETPQQVVETPSIPEFKMPEPIIVTDYSKQYDPVMPLTPENITPTVDFKEVINAIRECSNKIEQYGFKIDVEEYDLANLYQVVFKVEK